MKLTPEQQTTVESLVSLANALAYKHCPGDEEARSVACLVLCKAVSQYNRDRGTKIGSYCYKVIEQEIKNYRRDKWRDSSRFVSRPSDFFHKIPAKDDGGIEGVDVLDLLKVLPPRDREIFSERYLTGASLLTLSKKWGVTKQRIHQIITRSKERLRREIDGDNSRSSAFSRV